MGVVDTIKYETQTASADILKRLSAPTTQEIVPLDQTNEFEAQEQTEGQKATTVQSFIESVQVHEVTTHEKEKQLAETDTANTKQGTVRFEELIVPQIDETIVDSSAGELAAPAPAKTETLIQKSVEIELKIPNTIQIIPIDSHGTHEEFTYTEQTASELHDKKQSIPVTTSEVQIVDQSESLPSQMLDEKVANIVQTYKEHLRMTQVELLVSENVLQVNEAPESKTAIHTFDKALKTPIKSEVLTQDTLGDISHEMSEQKQATVKTDTGLVTSVKEHIETQDTYSILQYLKPTEESASQKHVEHETVITQEHTIISQEGVLPDDFKPDTFTAKPAIDSISIAQASETIIQDSTFDLKEQIPVSEEASVKQSEISHKLPQSTEARIHECVDTFGETIPAQDIAQPDVIKLSAPIIHETLVQEQTVTLETSSVPDKKAHHTQSLLENIQITEIVSHESENLLTTGTRPDARQAEATLDEVLRIPLKSETLTSETIADSMITQPTEETATGTQTLSEALQIHMIETGAKESQFAAVELPNSSNAVKTIDSKLLAAVKQEVIDANHVDEFLTPKFEMKTLQESLIDTQLKIPSAHETIVHESVEKLLELSPIQDTAEMKFDTVNAAVVQESVPHEGTDGFYELDTVGKIANLKHDEAHSATIEEAIALDSAKDLLCDEKPEQKTAGSTYDMLKTGVKTEVLTSETTNKAAEIPKPKVETATEFSPIPFEALTVHATEVIDKESTMSDFKQPSMVQAQKVILEFKVPEKIQIVADSHVTELVMEEPTQDMVEHISINLGFPTHQSEQIISTESVSELKPEKIVEEEATTEVLKLCAASTAETLTHEEALELGMNKKIIGIFILKFLLKIRFLNVSMKLINDKLLIKFQFCQLNQNTGRF